MATVLEISSDERFASSLAHIKTKVGALAVQVTAERRGSREYLRIQIAAARQTRAVVCALIDAISEVIITDCKAHYIQTRIRLPIEDPIARHAFIKALVTFDRDTDRIIAKTLIKITSDFYLDSFYEFMIDVLKDRWNEVCLLANENICYLVCQKTFAELLRFLISNIESQSDEAHLFVRGEEIEVLGRGLKPLNDIYVNQTLPPDIRLVTKLVAIAPRKIFLHMEETAFDSRLVQNIENLFGGCVVVTKMIQ